MLKILEAIFSLLYFQFKWLWYATWLGLIQFIEHLDKEQLYIFVKIFFLTKWQHKQNLAVQLYIHSKKHVSTW